MQGLSAGSGGQLTRGQIPHLPVPTPCPSFPSLRPTHDRAFVSVQVFKYLIKSTPAVTALLCIHPVLYTLPMGMYFILEEPCEVSAFIVNLIFS